MRCLVNRCIIFSIFGCDCSVRWMHWRWHVIRKIDWSVWFNVKSFFYFVRHWSKTMFFSFSLHFVLSTFVRETDRLDIKRKNRKNEEYSLEKSFNFRFNSLHKLKLISFEMLVADRRAVNSLHSNRLHANIYVNARRRDVVSHIFFSLSSSSARRHCEKCALFSTIFSFSVTVGENHLQLCCACLKPHEKRALVYATS